MSRWKLEGECVTVTKGKDRDDMSCTPLQFSMVIKNLILVHAKGAENSHAALSLTCITVQRIVKS
jgi:hypothetical protein